MPDHAFSGQRRQGAGASVGAGAVPRPSSSAAGRRPRERVSANSGQRRRLTIDSRRSSSHRRLVGLRRLGDDRTVGDHPLDHLLAEFGAHDGERPVVVLADAAGGDVGVLGGEVGAARAALTRPLVALLQVDLVVRAVLHPDLEDALDVHLHHVLLLQAVLGLEQLGEDRVVERLRAQQPDVEQERLGDLAGLAVPHHRRRRRLAAHADERQALVALLLGLAAAPAGWRSTCSGCRRWRGSPPSSTTTAGLAFHASSSSTPLTSAASM